MCSLLAWLKDPQLKSLLEGLPTSTGSDCSPSLSGFRVDYYATDLSFGVGHSGARQPPYGSALRLGFGLKSVPVVAAQVLPNCASVSHSRLSLALDSRRMLLQSRMTKLRRVCRWWDACKPPSLRGQETHIGWRTWVSRLPSLAGIYVKPTADAAGIAHLPVSASLSPHYQKSAATSATYHVFSQAPKTRRVSSQDHSGCFYSFRPGQHIRSSGLNPKPHNPPNPAS